MHDVEMNRFNAEWVMNDWDIVALSDGKFGGEGYNYELTPGDYLKDDGIAGQILIGKFEEAVIATPVSESNYSYTNRDTVYNNCTDMDEGVYDIGGID